MKVTKNDGRLEDFDITKFKRQVAFDTQGTSIKPEEFEQKIHLFLKDGIKTSDLQNTIVNTALNQTDITSTEWLKVAGRAMMWNLYGEVYKHTGFKMRQWKEHMKYLEDKGYYREEVLQQLEKLNINESDIDYGDRSNISPLNPDFNMVASQVLSLDSKYVIKHKNVVIEYPFMIDIANAALLAETREEFFMIYEELRQGNISLATPFKRNMRRPNGNVGSCYIGAGIDSLVGINKGNADIGYVSQKGGGIGWYIGKIRPGNSWSQNVVKSNNISKWAKIINDIAVAVNQGGVRPAGVTLGYDWWQMDIESFLEIKSELHGDLRDKSFDVFPQVLVDNYFIDAVIENKDVYLVNHYTYRQKTGVDITELIDEDMYQEHLKIAEMVKSGELISHGEFADVKPINARRLWKKIWWTWVEVGDEFIVHKDNINRDNVLKYDQNGNRMITYCANLCTESFSVVKPATDWVEKVKNGEIVERTTNGLYHACNLVSINVANIDKDNFELERIANVATYILDRSIDVADAPIEEANKLSYLLRNIGIGVVGMADYMAYNNAMFDTDEGILKAKKLIEQIAYYSYKASIDLAVKKGSYPLYDPKNHKKLFNKTGAELNQMSAKTGNNFDWEELLVDIRKKGLRNFLLLAIAPNSSTGMLMGVSSGILPVFNKLNYETNKSFSVPVAPKFIKEKHWYYKTRYQYKPQDIVRFVSEMQDFIDTGISMELNLNPDLFTIKELSDMVLSMFKQQKLKAVYYSTTLDKDNETTKEITCFECAN